MGADARLAVGIVALARKAKGGRPQGAWTRQPQYCSFCSGRSALNGIEKAAYAKHGRNVGICHSCIRTFAERLYKTWM